MTTDNAGTETVDAPAAAPDASHEVTPGGGIVTRTDGTPSPTDWRASLSAELQAEKSLDLFKGKDWSEVGPNLAKSYVNAQKLVGKGIEFPAADAKPEQVADFRKRAGIPESPDKYAITLPKPPEGSGMEIDPKLLSTFLGRMHAVHARPDQVQAALNMYAEHMAANWDRLRNQQAQDEANDGAAVIAELEKKWGPRDGPMWKHHLGRADLAVRTFMAEAPPSAVQRVVDQINGDAELAHAWSLMADSLLERGFLGEDEMPSGLGASDAQQRADTIRDAAAKDPQHPLRNEHHPEHAKVVKEFLELNAIAAGPRGREVVAEARR